MENQVKHPLTDKVVNIIDQIRPYLQNDGGDISFVRITEDNVVEVQLQGACHSCPMATQTMRNGVEATVLKYVPEIKAVIAINI